MPRGARLDAPGTLHHVIVRGIEKRRIVDDRWDRRNFVSRLGQVASDTQTDVYAWALMTNHAHILLRSSQYGLSRFMRRFLTGYAITYNLRHKRHGHLFQNRYKSIVCDEDAYFRELVRYIHLNPLRAEVVKNMSELDKYHWSGHSVLMGKVNREWQDRDYVLSWFGQKEWQARRAYRKYVEEGVQEGRRPELVGGGLVRSLGGWSQVLSLRRENERVLADERILGTGDFVRKVVSEADERIKYQLGDNERREKAQQLIEQTCKKEDVNANELRMGSRRGRIARVRGEIAYQLVERYGFSLAEVGRQLGVTTSAISKVICRLSKT
jgi:REP element-mobilizing transposase RayT